LLSADSCSSKTGLAKTIPSEVESTPNKIKIKIESVESQTGGRAFAGASGTRMLRN